MAVKAAKSSQYYFGQPFGGSLWWPVRRTQKKAMIVSLQYKALVVVVVVVLISSCSSPSRAKSARSIGVTFMKSGD